MLTMLRTKLGVSVTLSLLVVSSAAFAAHSMHRWSKVSESEGMNGKIICTWECDPTGGESHFATTSGFGLCSRP